jgi:hypothetical protein
MTITVTLGDIRERKPCSDGWTKLLRALGETEGKPNLSRVIGLGDVLIANGRADAQWCFRAVRDPRQRVSLIMPAVKRASVHTTDERVHDCIAALDRWRAGDDTVDLRPAAARAWAWAAAAEAAAWAAAEAARAAAAAEAEAAAEAARAAAAAAAEAAAAAAAEAAAAEAAAEAAELANQDDDIMRLSPPLWLAAAPLITAAVAFGLPWLVRKLGAREAGQ